MKNLSGLFLLEMHKRDNYKIMKNERKTMMENLTW